MLTFVQGDTRPSLVGTLTFPSTDDPVDLTDCSVRFQMRKADDRRNTVSALATVTDAAHGQVRYDWGANELAVPGLYHVQFEITFPDLSIQTTDPPVEIEIRRQ